MIYRLKKTSVMQATMWTIVLASIFSPAVVWSENPEKKPIESLDIENVIQGIEQRYSGIGFEADFEQASTLKVMKITDKAFGKALFKRPGKMRWEYESPEKQIIVTDGEQLWVYRPEDKQVMLGSFPSFFGGGKGGSFLADMGQIRQKFDISFSKQYEDPQHYSLALQLKQPNDEIKDITILVKRDDFVVDTIVTHNTYDDETRISFKNVSFKETIDDNKFIFVIPDQSDIIKID